MRISVKAILLMLSQKQAYGNQFNHTPKRGIEMNISKEIQDYTSTLKNDDWQDQFISTGGGFDYVWRKFDGGHEVVLSGQCHDGSPDTLDEPAALFIYDSNDWAGPIVIEFDTAKAAIANLALMYET